MSPKQGNTMNTMNNIALINKGQFIRSNATVNELLTNVMDDVIEMVGHIKSKWDSAWSKDLVEQLESLEVVYHTVFDDNKVMNEIQKEVFRQEGWESRKFHELVKYRADLLAMTDVEYGNLRLLVSKYGSRVHRFSWCDGVYGANINIEDSSDDAATDLAFEIEEIFSLETVAFDTNVWVVLGS